MVRWETTVLIHRRDR